MGREKRPTTFESIDNLSQVATALEVSATTKEIFHRPDKGWLRSVRQLYGLNLNEIALRRNIAPQVLLRAEVAESQDRITIKNLRAIADAMGFDLFYCLIPRDSPAGEALNARISEALLQGSLDAPKAEMVRALMMDGKDRKPTEKRLMKRP
jgi:hypothetical protein